MREAIEELYNRIGRWLRPPIRSGIVETSKGPLSIRRGTCYRTGLQGDVILYPDTTVGPVPLLAHLVWMYTYQPLPTKTEEIKDRRLGGSPTNELLVMTPDRILTNIGFQAKIPGLEIMDGSALFREIAALHDPRGFLFMGFAKSVSRVLDGRLRRSYDVLEVNGDLQIGKSVTISNGSLDLRKAAQFAGCGIEADWDKLRRLHYFLRLEERSNYQQAELEKLRLSLGLAERHLMMLRQLESHELSIAERLRV